MAKILLQELFIVDQLSVVMMALILFLGASITRFASRYLAGDRRKANYMLQSAFLLVSMLVLVTADNLWLFYIAWLTCNLLLVRLMVHKTAWRAAVASGKLAFATFIIGYIALAAGFAALSNHFGTYSIHQMVYASSTSSTMLTSGLVLLIVAAMTQSAIWPFHKWLMSSLNSPTPVSALMHAGLVNGGGFLLARFAPIYLPNPDLLNVIFVVGALSAMLGTFWKLMQPDIKRMLACSTMGQMGFMMVQCGLGLFPAAVAHLCWHGMFKAYLFLASGGSAAVRRRDLTQNLSIGTFIACTVCALAGSFFFAQGSEKSWISNDANFFLVIIAAISSFQFALSALQRFSLKTLPIVLLLTSLMAAFYGWNVYLIESILHPLPISQPVSLSVIHWVVLAIMLLVWLKVTIRFKTHSGKALPSWLNKSYVAFLNASQPNPKTITSFRNHYSY